MTWPDFLILCLISAGIVFAGERLLAALSAWLDEEDQGKQGK